MIYTVTCAVCVSPRLGTFYGLAWTPPWNVSAERSGDEIARERAGQLRDSHRHAGAMITEEPNL